HAGDRVGDPAGLFRVGRTRGEPGLHRAEPARPGAHVSQDHEGGGAAVPAVADVRAVGLLADGVEVQTPHEIPQPLVALAHRGARLDPLGPREEKDGSAHATLRTRSLLFLLLVLFVVIIVVVPVLVFFFFLVFFFVFFVLVLVIVVVVVFFVVVFV